jgi:HAD superfamily hydrolase (TIGR01509 family)
VTRALVLDCDGVLADTERDGHRPAFNQAFRELGLPLEWSEEEYGSRLHIGGGKERIASALTPELVERAGLPRDPTARQRLIAAWHRRKSEIYGELVAQGRLPGRPGIRRLVQEAADAGWALAVASTSAEPSVRGVLEYAVGPALAARFLVLAGDVVARKKPAPDIYVLALEKLGLPARSCLAVEDSRNGLLAAVGAGLRCLVTLSSYTREEDMAEACLVVSDLGEPGAPMRVVANRSEARPGGYVALADLEACLGTGVSTRS